MDITVVDSILFFNEYVKDGLAPARANPYAVGVTLGVRVVGSRVPCENLTLCV